MRFAVIEPAPRPVSPRDHRPHDGTVADRHDLGRDVRLGAFTEGLLGRHVSAARRPRGLARWFHRTAVDDPGRERRLLPGVQARALTSRGR